MICTAGRGWVIYQVKGSACLTRAEPQNKTRPWPWASYQKEVSSPSDLQEILIGCLSTQSEWISWSRANKTFFSLFRVTSSTAAEPFVWLWAFSGTFTSPLSSGCLWKVSKEGRRKYAVTVVCLPRPKYSSIWHCFFNHCVYRVTSKDSTPEMGRI